MPLSPLSGRQSKPADRLARRISSKGWNGFCAGASRAARQAANRRKARLNSRVFFKWGTLLLSPYSRYLENAGYPGQKTTETSETGTIHTVGKTDVRIMNGGSGGPPRVVTTRAGTNDPVQQNGRQFPSGTPRQIRRDDSHTDLPQ